VVQFVELVHAALPRTSSAASDLGKKRLDTSTGGLGSPAARTQRRRALTDTQACTLRRERMVSRCPAAAATQTVSDDVQQRHCRQVPPPSSASTCTTAHRRFRSRRHLQANCRQVTVRVSCWKPGRSLSKPHGTRILPHAACRGRLSLMSPARRTYTCSGTCRSCYGPRCLDTPGSKGNQCRLV
jgi:hypothetical protein